jgi:hypothetical protein
LAQNSKVSNFDFTEKCQFAGKTDQNSVFHGHETHIPDRVQITVPYKSFYEFENFQILAQNSKGLTLDLTKKTPVCGKN